MDLCVLPWLRRAMESAKRHRINLLVSEVGALMEDASHTALTLSRLHDPELIEVLASLSASIERMENLVNAAQALAE